MIPWHGRFCGIHGVYIAWTALLALCNQSDYGFEPDFWYLWKMKVGYEPNEWSVDKWETKSWLSTGSWWWMVWGLFNSGQLQPHVYSRGVIMRCCPIIRQCSTPNLLPVMPTIIINMNDAVELPRDPFDIQSRPTVQPWATTIRRGPEYATEGVRLTYPAIKVRRWPTPNAYLILTV